MRTNILIAGIIACGSAVTAHAQAFYGIKIGEVFNHPECHKQDSFWSNPFRMPITKNFYKAQSRGWTYDKLCYILMTPDYPWEMDIGGKNYILIFPKNESLVGRVMAVNVIEGTIDQIFFHFATDPDLSLSDSMPVELERKLGSPTVNDFFKPKWVTKDGEVVTWVFYGHDSKDELPSIYHAVDVKSKKYLSKEKEYLKLGEEILKLEAEMRKQKMRRNVPKNPSSM